MLQQEDREGRWQIDGMVAKWSGADGPLPDCAVHPDTQAGDVSSRISWRYSGHFWAMLWVSIFCRLIDSLHVTVMVFQVIVFSGMGTGHGVGAWQSAHERRLVIMPYISRYMAH